MLPKPPKHVRRVRAKGRSYYYFDTGRLDAKGKRVWTRMPDMAASEFWGSYAAHMGHRNRRAKPAAMTIPKLVDLYERSPQFRSLAPKSQDAYAMYLRRLETLLPTAPAGEVTRGDMRRLIDGMAQTPGAANLFMGTCSALFKWAVGREYIASSPTAGIAPLPMGEHAPWPEHVLTAALASKDRSVRLLTHLLYYTALRLNDALSLSWSSIEGDRIRVRHSKNRRDMDIRMHADLATELATHPRRALTIAVNDDGSSISEEVARSRLQKFAADMGAKVVPHGLRKNAVNALLEAGASVAETASVSGQSLQMVEHYAKQRNQARLSTSAVLLWETKR